MPANPSRAAFRAEGKRRRRRTLLTAATATATVSPIAFRHDDEARHAIDTNPNRAKRHAAPTGDRATGPRLTDRGHRADPFAAPTPRDIAVSFPARGKADRLLPSGKRHAYLVGRLPR